CRLRGGEIICILNPDDCSCGIKDKIHKIPFENGEVIAAPNSLLISIKFTFKDEIEEFVFLRIRSYLAEQKNQPVSVLKKPVSDDYSITFFVHYDNTKVAGNPEKIIAFFNNFERNLAQAVVQGKMAINKFLRNFGAVFYKQ
ncbi:MAG: hypothetical protein ACTSRU_12760, partial [Candidatus Hodarchaeales archaeon]